MHRHIPSSSAVVLIREKLTHELFECESALLENTSLTVLTEHNVVIGQGRGRANGNSFFACVDLFHSSEFSKAWTKTAHADTYHIEAQPALALCLKHNHIHDADYPSLAWPTTRLQCSKPVSIFLYHVKTSSSETSGAPRVLSTISPSESMTR